RRVRLRQLTQTSRSPRPLDARPASAPPNPPPHQTGTSPPSRFHTGRSPSPRPTHLPPRIHEHKHASPHQTRHVPPSRFQTGRSPSPGHHPHPSPAS
ncbi:MAG: hypothetical protein ACK5UT_05880, partial [Acidobacteriota bacterium]